MAKQWEKLGLLRYAEIYTHKYAELLDQKEMWDLETVCLNNRRSIFLGSAHMGKTYALLREGYNLAQAAIHRLQNSEAGTANVLVPIFARLESLAKKEGELLERLQKVLAQHSLPYLDDLWDLISEKIKEGTVIMLLDAWDRVQTRRQQEELREVLEGFVYRYPECRLYLTSRIAGYLPLHIDAPEWEVVGFSEAQVEQYIHRFFSSNSFSRKRGVAAQPLRVSTKKAALLVMLRQHPWIMTYARVPRVLALLCWLYWELEIPEPEIGDKLTPGAVAVLEQLGGKTPEIDQISALLVATMYSLWEAISDEDEGGTDA
jgi:hypothetical protein